MTCPRCQKENPPGSNFCQNCGTRLSAACTACGNDLAAGSRFCNQCGTPVSGESVAQGRFAAPESYTPKYLAEKILTSKASLEGERKQVTVLFADLKGSTELLADRDPEDARSILDPVLERMMEAVHRYEGTVNQVMGDGIMALFGAPLAHEDHAVRACYAALRMQDAARRYSDELHRTQGVTVQIRIGLNSGYVVVRSIDSDLHMDYRAVGATTHLAARMEQLAVPGSIRLTAETMRLAAGFVQVTPLGAVPVKGFSEAVEAFELVGADTVRTRFEAAARRGLTRFVGREGELEQLGQALDQARSGHGQVVALVGEPGIGKSRLYWEFTHSHRTQGWLVIESGSVSYSKATNYLPMVELLRAYFQIEARDDLWKIREKVTGRLLSLDRHLESALPALLWLLDVPVEDPSWERLDPPQRRQQTLDGIKRLLLRESRVQPLIVVFEDLHWIDADTQALLDSLVESLPTARLLLLVNYRPEYVHAWSSKTSYRQLRIDSLPEESAEELLEALLGHDDGLQPLKRLLIERTEGNPFFLEESVRTLVETRILTGERGAYRLAKSHEGLAGTLQIPATAQALLAARIDRLPAEAKRLLQAASVIGTDAPFILLQAIAGEDDTELRRGLAQLQAAEFLYERQLFPDLEYTFKHALTHEVAYGTLVQERRRTLHAAIVDAIERLHAGHLEEHVERLAHHALRGEIWEKAVRYLRQAGAKAFARSANRESAAYFEQALTALQHLPESRESLEQAIDLRFDLRTAHVPLGEFGTVFRYLTEAERLARTLDDQRRLGWVSVYMSHYFWIASESTDASAFGESARAIAETLGDLSLQVGANFYVGGTCVTAGDYRRAEDLLRSVVQLLEGDLDRQRFGLAGFPAVLSRTFLAWSLAQRGEFEEGAAHGEEGLRIAEAVDHAYSLVLACWGLGCLRGIKGEFGQAIHLLERGLASARDWGVTLVAPRIMWSLGHVYAWSGRVAPGLALLEQALEAVESIGLRSYQSLVLVQLGEAYLLADRSDEALGLARRAHALARQRGQRGYEAWGLHLLGAIASHRDPLDAQGEGHYREALALAGDLGMRPLVAHCQLGLGRLYRRTGQWPDAQEHFTAAITMYREMDMRFWLGKAEAERNELT